MTTVIRILLLILVIGLLVDLAGNFDPFLAIVYASALIGAVAANLLTRSRPLAALAAVLIASAVSVLTIVSVAALSALAWNDNDRALLLYFILIAVPLVSISALVAGWLAADARVFLESRRGQTRDQRGSSHV